MGRATIVSGGDAGLYTVSIDYGSEQLAALIASETEALAVKQAELFEAQTELTSKEAGVPALVTVVSTAMEALKTKWTETCTGEGWVKDPVSDEISTLEDLLWQRAELQGEQAELEAALPGLDEAQKAAEDAAKAAQDALGEAEKTAEGLYRAYVSAYWEYRWADPESDPEYLEYLLNRYLNAYFEWRYYVYFVLPGFQSDADAAYDDYLDAKAEYDDAVTRLEEIGTLLDELEPLVADAYAAYQKAVVERTLQLKKCELVMFAEEYKALYDAQEKLQALYWTVNGLKARVELLEAQIATIQFHVDYLTLIVSGDMTETREMWCADLTEPLSAGSLVATMEIPGERVANSLAQIIAPQYWAEIQPDETQGKLLSREVMSPAQAYWNFSVLPGWQKWRPMYRVGTLTSISYEDDTGSVTLDAALSSAQGLNVNQEWPLDQIPIRYLTCNAQAFVVGDRVVVAFGAGGWTDASIIGFESAPVGCPAATISWTLVLEEGPNSASDFPDSTCCVSTLRGWIFLDYQFYYLKPDGSRHEIGGSTGSGTSNIGCGDACLRSEADGTSWFPWRTYWIKRQCDAVWSEHEYVGGCYDCRTGGGYEETYHYTWPAELNQAPAEIVVDGWRYWRYYPVGIGSNVRYILSGRAE